MDDGQYKTIEAQALQIVGTLNKLKVEIEGYRDAKVETQRSLASLDALLGAVTDAASQLSNAAKNLRDSDYTQLHKKLSKETELLTTVCGAMQLNIEVIPEKIQSMLDSQETKQESTNSAFEARIEKTLEADSTSRIASQQKIEKACDNVISKFNELPATLATSLETHSTNQIKKDEKLFERISNLEQIILRIDRNTQKGFRKERG